MSKYYYLVAGLPELTLEDSKQSYTVADFKTEIYTGLSASDQKLIDLFYLKFDNANVLKLLKDKEAAIDTGEIFPRRNWRNIFLPLKREEKSVPRSFPLILLLSFPLILILRQRMLFYWKIIWLHFIMIMR